MPFNFTKLLKETEVRVTYGDPAGIKLDIIMPELRISSVEESDISFYQELWSDPEVMEKFAEGKVRMYSGSEDEKKIKVAQNQEPDYAKWQIAERQNSWLKRRQANNIWHGLTVFNGNNQRIGHIVLGGGELAYFLVKHEWNKGYMSKAAAALVRIAVPYIALNHQSIDIPEEINATVRTDHRASQIVLERAGFVINDETHQTQKYGNMRYEPVIKVANLVREYQQVTFVGSGSAQEGILPAVSMFEASSDCAAILPEQKNDSPASS